MRVHRTRVAPLLACLALFAGAYAAELPLSADQLVPRGPASAAFEDGVVRLTFDNPHGAALRIVPPPTGGDAAWDFSGHRVLALDVENRAADVQLRLTLHVLASDPVTGKDREVVGGVALNPGEKHPIRIALPHARYAPPAGAPGKRVLDTARVTGLDVQMQWPFEGPRAGLVDAALSNLRLEDPVDPAGDADVPPQGDDYFPFIDAFGQYIHADWPEKIRDAADLPARRAAEQALLDADPRPAAWNRFGGWADGPQREATGAFRTEKIDGKWWLVDPEGKLFFSHGVDVLIAHTDATPTKDRARWFAESVPEDGRVAFTDRNLRAKYGQADYADAFYATLAQRLQHWGMNTIGDWGHPTLIATGRTPYTLQLTDYNWSWPRVQGSKAKFYDVFHPDYVRGMKTLVPDAARKNPMVAPSLTDPFCIGYFIDNELNFGNRNGRPGFAFDVIRAPATQPAKREWLDDLKLKYFTVEALNEAWGTAFADWPDFLLANALPDTDAFRADADAFFARAADQYFRLCRDAVKSVAPHRLYLGTRFISTDALRPHLAEAAGKYCDVFSLNVYAHNVANYGGPRLPDAPVVIGEFHFGTYDRGMFSPGLVRAGYTQADRARAYTRFLQGALAHPNIVGAHWFQMRDQPLTGRGDGESYAIGFVDVGDNPYPELIEAARAVGERMYAYRARGTLVNAMED